MFLEEVILLCHFNTLKNFQGIDYGENNLFGVWCYATNVKDCPAESKSCIYSDVTQFEFEEYLLTGCTFADTAFNDDLKIEGENVVELTKISIEKCAFV